MRNLFLLFLFSDTKNQDSVSPVSLFGSRVTNHSFTIALKRDGDDHVAFNGLLIHRVLPESFTVSECLRQLDNNRRLSYSIAATELADYYAAFEYGVDGVQSIIVKKNRLTLDSIDTIHAVLGSMPPLYTGAI